MDSRNSKSQQTHRDQSGIVQVVCTKCGYCGPTGRTGQLEEAALCPNCPYMAHVVRPVQDRLRAVLKDHYLTGVECDPATKRDRPSCQCSLVDLGWHPSIGQAVDAWIEHVMEVLG